MRIFKYSSFTYVEGPTPGQLEMWIPRGTAIIASVSQCATWALF